MDTGQQPQSAVNKCPECGMAVVHSVDEYGSYVQCTSCPYKRMRTIQLVHYDEWSNDDWREDWLNYDEDYDDETTPWSHMFVNREPPALQFRRDISPYMPRVWQKGNQLSDMAQGEILAYAKNYLDICLDIVESRQMYRALIDLGFDKFLQGYTRRDYLWIIDQCNNFTTRKPCKKCGCPVYFLPENEPRLITCEHCQVNLPTLRELKTMPYVDYLRSDHWKQVRQDALERANRRCQLCNKGDGLHVHHRTYERRGEELPEDVTVLCAECHKTFHDNRRLHS